jgi:hypothetical protein
MKNLIMWAYAIKLSDKYQKVCGVYIKGAAKI